MSLSRADSPGASARWPALPVAVSVAFALAGIATAMVGSLAGYRALYYVAVFALIGVAGMVAATRREPLRFVFLALIACFPVAAAEVPPGRIGLTVFDVVTIALSLGLIGKRMFAFDAASEPLFPTKSLLIAWLLCLPCVALSQFPLLSLKILVLNFAVYGFFLLALQELQRPRGFERLVLLFSVVSLFMAAGLFVDHFLQLNLSLRGSNLNQSSYVAGSGTWLARGLFPGPPKGRAFFPVPG